MSFIDKNLGYENDMLALDPGASGLTPLQLWVEICSTIHLNLPNILGPNHTLETLT